MDYWRCRSPADPPASPHARQYPGARGSLDRKCRGIARQAPRSFFTVPRTVCDTFDRHDALAFLDTKDGDALGRTALNADLRHRHPNGLALIADEHEMIGIFDRKRRYHRAVFGAHGDCDNAGAAASGDAEFV